MEPISDGVRLYQVDAFTAKPFSGNPAGVCVIDDEPIGESVMQKVAAEMNLSETAFVEPRPDGYSIRWFTPKVEVTLCGHATLASAHILWETGRVDAKSDIPFHSKSGILTARPAAGKIELNFPQIAIEPAAPNELVNRAFEITPVFTGKNGPRLLIEIADPKKLRTLTPDFQLLLQADLKTFSITCKSDVPEYDFLSRFFAPAVGIPEDPVTGSAHCYLAPYWSGKLGKKVARGFQASPRGGEVECEVVGLERVLLRGQAVTVFAGTLYL